jgi:isoquinoline 1-oxidoreductase subunit alpha
MTTLNINGQDRTLEIDAGTPLLWVLRDDLGLTGTKFACGRALCGACTVHVEGAATLSCVMPADGLQGKRITTIEGANDRIGAAVKRAWIELDVAQCGYCQPGQVMAAAALLKAVPRPSEADIDRALSGNLCRCGAYPRIRAAVHLAAQRLGGRG